MSSYLLRTRGIFTIPRFLPTLISRAQASQNTSVPPTPGQGVPISGSTKTVSQTGGTKKGDSSVLPSSATASDKTNPTKTSSDAPPLDHEHIDPVDKPSDKQRRDTSTSSNKSPSSSNPNKQSFISSRVGQFGAIAVLAIVIYYGYNMMSRNKKDLKNNEHYKKATADYQAVNAKNTDVKP
ncbi:unnamed protein product [Rotaria sp. Silwood1]|nr:unnamed protein product [Rotaria sp. Silwood1]CAF3639852.1 unnamed protein product [Rotaria sp. Silwood1]CAF3707590.1 unnamed protein product [Rotaria sp. Silwood1]CAF3728459.1 unnamed protein product [Rotaria sp. Silwood1]CAF4905290.1 unnamed protein product [Rotaria sp. Silwood1]